MKVFLVRNKSGIKAVGEYNLETKELVVLKGSIVSEKISNADKFRGANSVHKSRQINVRDRIVMNDILFNSASTAGNFVTGNSTNGLTAWKTENGANLRDAIK